MKSTVPKSLAQVMAKAAKHVDGKYCYGLPHYGMSSKVKLKLVDLGDMDLFEENDVDVDENPDWIPFAILKDESQFLAVSKQAPHAVGMWEHENGKIYPVWESIDDFIGRVIDKKDKTPFEQFEKILDKVSGLVEKDKYAEALKIIKPAIDALPMPKNASYEADDDLARGYNLYGLALKGTKDFAAARGAFEMAAKLGDDFGVLNILDMLGDDQKDWRAVVERGLELRASYLNDYARIWLARYLAEAYLELAQPAKAEQELKAIVARYAISDAEKITEARTALEEYIEDDRPSAAAAKPFLEWLKPKSYEVTPEQAKANKAWWKQLPEGARAKLMEAINNEDEKASDEDIARCLDVDSLSIDEDDGAFDELDAFLPLQNLKRLGFYGDPDSIEVLRTLPRLERLTINNEVIKNFQWPSRANRDLWKAAAKADKKGIEKALAAGADLHARGDHGSTALTMVAQEHDVGLCTMLIAKGADPWAGSHGESNAMYFFGDEEKAKLEAAAAKAGITHPDKDAYRELTVERMPNAATFESPDTTLEIDDGIAVAKDWPADIKLQMEAPKKDNKLYDMLRVTYDNAVVSEALAAVLRSDPNIELLPVTLVDHAGKPRPEKYFYLNPIAVDCLVIDKCFPQWNHIDPDSASEVAAYVIDPARVGPRTMFRPTIVNSRPMIVTRELAEKLKAFPGVRIGYLKR